MYDVIQMASIFCSHLFMYQFLKSVRAILLIELLIQHEPNVHSKIFINSYYLAV